MSVDINFSIYQIGKKFYIVIIITDFSSVQTTLAQYIDGTPNLPYCRGGFQMDFVFTRISHGNS
jgi:hypothetical protein